MRFPASAHASAAARYSSASTIVSPFGARAGSFSSSGPASSAWASQPAGAAPSASSCAGSWVSMGTAAAAASPEPVLPPAPASPADAGGNDACLPCSSRSPSESVADPSSHSTLAAPSFSPSCRSTTSSGGCATSIDEEAVVAVIAGPSVSASLLGVLASLLLLMLVAAVAASTLRAAAAGPGGAGALIPATAAASGPSPAAGPPAASTAASCSCSMAPGSLYVYVGFNRVRGGRLLCTGAAVIDTTHSARLCIWSACSRRPYTHIPENWPPQFTPGRRLNLEGCECGRPDAVRRIAFVARALVGMWCAPPLSSLQGKKQRSGRCANSGRGEPESRGARGLILLLRPTRPPCSSSSCRRGVHNVPRAYHVHRVDRPHSYLPPLLGRSIRRRLNLIAPWFDWIAPTPLLNGWQRP